MKRVVVTGLGALTPLGNSVNEFWHALKNGVSGAGPITRFDASKFKTRFACEVKDFDPLTILERQDVRKYDLFTRFALAAVQEAFDHASILPDKLDKERAGVIWGSGDGGVSTFEEQLGEYLTGNGTPRFNPYFIPKRIVNIASGVISIKYGLRGVNFTTVTACASSNTAIIEAFNQIRLGKADLIVAGGSEASITATSVGGFGSARALSTRNDEPETASRPFDISRDGFVIGEGAGALILESYEHAVKRDAPILAEVAGGGQAADAWHLTATHPDGAGAVSSMRLALKEAGVAPEEVDYINAHATSTPAGDLSELKAIREVFGATPDASVSATKSMTGHLLGSAGAVEAIACILAIREGIVPPTLNIKEPEPEFAGRFDLVPGKARQKPVRIAINNTFGFGGHAACSVFKKP